MKPEGPGRSALGTLLEQPLLKVSKPISDIQSPRASDSPRRNKQLHEKRMGEFLIKAEHIDAYSVSGYTVIYNNQQECVFEGEYMRSKKNGFGLQYTKGKVTFQGYFRDDKYDGWGRTPVYLGQYRDGLFDGYGIYSTQRAYYEGSYYEGHENGEGISFKGQQMLRLPPVKNIYDFLNQGLKHNMNIMKQYKIDEIYLGEWKNGCKHGFGRLWREDYWYSGQFSNDVPHGLGAEETTNSKEETKVTQTIYRNGTKKEK